MIELVADRVESLCGYKPEPDLVAEFLAQQIVQRQPARASGATRPTPLPAPAPAPPGRGAASSGFGFRLGGRDVPCRNARDVLVSVFEELVKRDPSFPERFTSLPKHGRTRRYLARERDELYPGRPDLVANHSHRLSCGWWLGVNISRKQVERIIRMACGVADLRFGRDLVIWLGD